jgi:subtilisin-like proprotein convertase family protein
VARRGEASVAGPVWSFRTRREVTNAIPAVIARPGAIQIPSFGEDGSANPYPSSLAIDGVAGQVAKVAVTLHSLTHSYPEDLDVLLVSPAGQAVLLMSDAGGSNAVNDVTLTLDDSAPGALPQSTRLMNGSYRPSNYSGYADDFFPPAPFGPYANVLGAFGGSDPNGTWSLYVQDNFSFEDGGVILGGWTLSLTLFYGDTDGDGLPDAYEEGQFGFDPENPLDALADADGDTASNLHEYLAGTDPFDPGNVLRITGFELMGNDVLLRFMSGKNRRYRVERLDEIGGAATIISEFDIIDDGVPGYQEFEILEVDGAARQQSFYRVHALPRY